MLRFLLPALLAGSCLIAPQIGLAGDEGLHPAAGLAFSFGGASGNAEPSAVRMVVRLRQGRTFADTEPLAEIAFSPSGNASFRLNGILLAARTPLIRGATETTPADASWFSANWKVIGLAAVGVAALAAVGGGGGDDAPADAPSTSEAETGTVCAVNGGQTQVPDVCSPGG